MAVVRLALVGPGLVGREVLQQLRSRPPAFLSLAAVVGSTHSVFFDEAADGAFPEAALAAGFHPRAHAAARPTQLDALAQHLLRPVSSSDSTSSAAPASAKAAGGVVVVGIVVDCTASQEVAELYPTWLATGLHVVTPNKKAFAGSLSLYQQIRAVADNRAAARRGLVFHESSVGAGLPVVRTLEDLVKTGDRIERIEGVLSGTLSFVFNKFSDPAVTSKFSEIIADAKARGYTEPDPRDDLNGMDVARKVVILARVAGFPLALEELPVENVVPPFLRDIASADEFMARLPEADAHFEALKQAALAEDKVLRYVGVVDPVEGSSVKLMSLPRSHPFASLSGSDNMVAFRTGRFPSPLVIRGAGAGAAVTAFGVLSDIWRIVDMTTYA